MYLWWRRNGDITDCFRRLRESSDASISPRPAISPIGEVHHFFLTMANCTLKLTVTGIFCSSTEVYSG